MRDVGNARPQNADEVDADLIGTVRAQLPSLDNRRDDVFGPPAALPGA